MINAEKYKEVLLKISNIHGSYIGKENDVFKPCDEVEYCRNCDFNSEDNHCSRNFMKWLLSEV